MNLTHILELDRMVLAWFNGSDSLFVDSWATTLTSGFTWIPLYVTLIYVIIKNNDTMPQIFLTIGCAVLAVVVVSVSVELIIKPLVGRWRPSNDPLIKHTIKIVNGMRGGQYGFFSAHAANTFSLAVYLSLLIKSRPFGRPLTAGRASISASITHSTSSSDCFGVQSWAGRHTHFTVVGASL